MMRILIFTILSCMSIVLISCQDEHDFTPSSLILVEGVINDKFLGHHYVVYADGIQQKLTAFSRKSKNHEELLEFVISTQNSSAAIIEDQFGVGYDINGRPVIEDGVEASALEPINHLVGYWFLFPSFYKKVVLNDGSEIINPVYGQKTEDWLIDTKLIFTGSSRDGIPSIDEPNFLTLDGRNLPNHPFYSSLGSSELVTIVEYEGETHVYPHRILEYHEVVNDQIGDLPITLSFCPLTGTSKAWSRNIKGGTVDFGVSGLLFNNNLIMYDRQTDSYWSQILDQSIYGPCISSRVTQLRTLETTWSVAQRIEGNVKYLDTSSSGGNDYSISTYDDYKANSLVSFPLSVVDDRLPAKDRVLGIIINNQAKVYSFSDFEGP